MDLDLIRAYVYDLHAGDTSGHDRLHLDRVEANARLIMAEEEGVDADLVVAIVLLHEVFDDKLDLGVSESDLVALLDQAGLSEDQQANLLHSVSHLSFSANLEGDQVLSREGQVAQDADRLDAIGAVGIARTFQYSGHKGEAMYSPEGVVDRSGMTKEDYRAAGGSSHQHFYDKLLKLAGKMNTVAGRRVAASRHQFMVGYLEQFEAEIRGDR